MKASEKLKMAEVLLRESCSAIQVGLFDNSLTNRIIHYLNLPDADEERKVSGHGPIYVPDAWDREAERYAQVYHTTECSKCLRVQQTKCVLCGDPIIIGVCENCAPWAFDGDKHFKTSDVNSFRKRLDSEIDTIIENEGNGHA